ncbi:MAG: MgtC/SapB family protein [Syntrophotaleaceae bacterium]
MNETAAWQFFESCFLAILLGALMGLERERQEQRLAGLRTFILVTLFGSLCGNMALDGAYPLMVPAGLLAITVQAAMVHLMRLKKDLAPGLTTSAALLVAYGIGVLLATGHTIPAVAISLATTVILYFKLQMHDFSRRLQQRDLYAIFQFILVAFIILPILPDRGFGPYQALNPYNIWLIVVPISAINLAGYITLKVAGQRWGGPVLGILGGIVSSTATTLSFSRYTRDNPAFSQAAALVVALASTVVLVRVACLVGVVHPTLLTGLALPLGAMFVGGLIPTFLIWRNTPHGGGPTTRTKNPVELPQALFFGLLYAAVILAVSAAKDYLGDSGVYMVALISGLTDVDAITLSNARLVEQGVLGASQAHVSILIALVSNLCFKLGLVGFFSTRQMFRWTLCCFICLALPALLILI